MSKIEVKSMLGEAVRRGGQGRALAALDDRATELCGALRRSVPALLRRGVAVQATPARIARATELVAELPGPIFEVPLVTDPGGSRAFLSFSGAATAYLVDAALGGSGVMDALEAAPKEITAPQRAVVTRIAGEMVDAISDVLASLGLRLRRLPSSPDTPFGGELVGITFRLGETSDRLVTLAVSRDAVQASSVGAPTATRSRDASAKVAGVLAGVEVEIAVELGRIRRSLLTIERLRVGDVLRLDTPVRSPLVVRCQERPVFLALPTAAGTQLAISILDRIEGGRVAGLAERPASASFATSDSEP